MTSYSDVKSRSTFAVRFRHLKSMHALKEKKTCNGRRPITQVFKWSLSHNFLLERLKQCGISGTAQSLFKSYFEDRSQKVHLRGSSSASSSLRFGVPQGSVLGPILFLIYTIPLGELCRRHGVQYHLYADDTQLYVSFKLGNAVDLLDAQRRIKMCIAEIKAWMVMFMLKLNDNKTELVIIAPPYFLQHN